MGYKRLPVALRRASWEGRCKSRHADFAFRRGFVYCPWCGIELKFEITCERCGKKFNGTDAYAAHLDREFRERIMRCPQGADHVVHFRKHRNTIYCDYCCKEYPLPPRKQRGHGGKLAELPPLF